MNSALLTTSLGDIPLTARGKVRDLYAVGDELLFIATDRISAFDHVLGSGIPGKGKILTQLSHFWFDFLAGTVPNHLLASPSPSLLALLAPYTSQTAGRSMLVRRAEMFPVECVVRGYISGSGWKDYLATGSVCGIELPRNLRESDQLPEPIFTPAAKINTGGHDENISYETMVNTIGSHYAAELRRLTFAIYEKASDHAASKNLILADTKFEFGLVDGEIVLADEVLTPGLFPLLARRHLLARRPAAQLRQAVRPRLPRIYPLEQAGPARRALPMRSSGRPARSTWTPSASLPAARTLNRILKLAVEVRASSGSGLSALAAAQYLRH